MKYFRSAIITIFFLFVFGLCGRLIPDFYEKSKAERIYPIRQQCRDFLDAVSLYKANYGAYPEEKNALTILINDSDCRMLLKKTNLDDPWGTPFRFRIIDGHPVVDSAGPDRKFDTPDDIKSF
jgi:Type II secretion system (T2SS), protein G